MTRRHGGAVVACAVAFAALAGCGHVSPDRVGVMAWPSTAAPATVTPDTTPTTAPAGEAVTALAALPVKGRAPKTGYARSEFPHWRDTDGDGCDADDQAVKAWASVELRDGCREVAATMTDPYTGDTLTWGASRVGVVDIDHAVSLSDAWQKGAQQLTRAERAALANDPLNLVPVAASVNRSKGDSDAASWLPPSKGYRCAFVARQVAVKAQYRLWVTEAERDAIAGVLEGCPGERLPVGAR